MPFLVTAIIKPYKLDEVKEALRQAGVLGLTSRRCRDTTARVAEPTFRGSSIKSSSSRRSRSRRWLTRARATDRRRDRHGRAHGQDRRREGMGHGPRSLMRVRTGEFGDDAV